MHLRQTNSYFRGGTAVFGLAAAAGQTQDTSGNGLLKGSFRFRHVAIQNVDANYNPTEITATYGTITFDGAGNYTVTGTTVDNTVSSGAPQPLNVTGTYAIGSNGAGYIANPLYPTDSNAYIYGAVAQGVYTGSSTESGEDDRHPERYFHRHSGRSRRPRMRASPRPIRPAYWISPGRAARRSRTRCSS